MTNRKAYTFSFTRHMFSVSFLFLLLLLSAKNLYAQEEPEYDEILVFLEIPRIGGFEIPAVIKGQQLYLPVTDLFDLLKIKNEPSQDLESVSGFFITPEAPFAISKTNNNIKYHDKIHNLDPGDLVRTETSLYLRSEYFGKIFGLDCFFNFRSLSVTVSSKLELPLIREMRLEEMRKNLSRLKGEMIADTTIRRSYPMFRFGMADWSAISTQEINGRTDTRLNLALGAMLAGGEATASLNYNSFDKFSERQQYYLWRYVDNDYSVFKQAMAGKIATQATSTLFNPVVGVQFTNTPTTYRRSFGTYTLSDRTEPGWIVELYVNNVLVDYIKADASGFFQFQVPLVYGNSIIQLKFYGPWGEEKVKEQNINIPFNFLPEKTFEYRVSAGVVEDSSFSRFSRVSMNYGVSRFFTFGGGVEYLSSVTSSPVMPYVNASWNVFNNILLSGEYTHGVRTKGAFSYRMPSNIQLDLNYTKYVRGQTAIMYNYLEERKASLALPLRLKGFSSYNRFSVYQIVLPSVRMVNGELTPSSTDYTTGEWMFSGTFLGLNTNFTTYGIFIGKTDPFVYSNLSLSLRLPANFVVMPQAQYGYTHNEFISARLAVEKRIKENAFLNFSLEQNFNNNLKMAELGFRYNFSFAQAGMSVRQSNRVTSLIEYARGSLIYDKKTRFLGTDNQFNVGKGGISVIPFIDLNANGIRDAGEPKAPGLNLRATGGRVEKSESDTTIRILGLEPYTSCFLDLDANSFENISWRLPVRVLNVAVDPEIMKHIEIPVTVVGEASGTVSLEKRGDQGGIGRMIVRFFTKSHKPVGSTLTEDDGYFTWFGLTPGDFYAAIDTSQLSKLGMISVPVTRDFTIIPGLDGDVVDGLDFNLRMAESDTVVPEVKKAEPVIRKDTSVMIVHEVVEELVTITKDSWAIQLGAFRNRNNADNLRKNLERLLGRKVDIVIADGYFKVRINEIDQRSEVDRIVEVLRRNGITELWIISLKAKEQQVVLRERTDSVIRVVETRVEEPAMFESRIFLPMGEDFYNLDNRPRTSITDQTVLEIMERTSALEKV
ncbi:MAG: SPOR domain-containing protein, partial [Chloroflexota bacterium]